MNTIPKAIIAAILLGMLPAGTADGRDGAGALIPEDGDRVIFFGDSITQAGDYVLYVEAYLLTRFPDRRIDIINHGISSETISGLSEPDHVPRRPDAHDRFDRDVAAWQPDLIVSCFGMNDGIYHPFDPDRFDRFKDGTRRLLRRAEEEADARRIDVLTPPPFDPYRRTVGDPEALEYGYKYPFIDYDDVLRRYGEWLLTLRDEGRVIADTHGAIAEHLRRRRRDRVSLSLSPDAVHPDRTGHWLMAQSLLHAWDAPATVSEARIDAGALDRESTGLSTVSLEGGVLRFDWETPLPMPIDPSWDPASIALEGVADRLNRHRLHVEGLDAPRYRLLAGTADAEPEAIGAFDREVLAAGIDLTAFPEFPTMIAARAVLERLSAHRKAQYGAWRATIRGESAPDAPPRPGDDAEAMASIRALCRPITVRIILEPIAADPGD